jgi:hypothetical protein
MMKKPARYIITGVDATRVSTPVLARVKCENSSGSFENIFPIEAVHGYGRNQREEGFIVNVEWLYEVPQEAQNWWAEYFIAVGGK